MSGAGLSQGCGTRRFVTLIAAEKAVERGAEGTPQECTRGGLLHWHLTGSAAKGLQSPRESSIPDAVRQLVLDRDGYACVCCGVSIFGRRYSLGHRVRAGQGGKAVPSNLVTLLGWGGEACHGRIDFRRDPEDQAKGYALWSYEDPLLVPVMIMSASGSGASVWLDDEGGWSTEGPSEVAA